jgi:hypothetical protein
MRLLLPEAFFTLPPRLLPPLLVIFRVVLIALHLQPVEVSSLAPHAFPTVYARSRFVIAQLLTTVLFQSASVFSRFLTF